MNAPDFSLKDQTGNLHTLKQYRGRWVILYFYPRDDTPGCTKEACSFRDGMDEYEKRNVAVLGVSSDSVASHKKFADKHKLNFPILSDPTLGTIKKYGAWGEKRFMGKVFSGINRNTYIINPSGELVKTYEKVNPVFHSEEILRYLESVPNK